MPLSNLLRPAAGTCRYCGNKAGGLTRDHPDCKAAHQSGWHRMVELAADAARFHAFDEKTLRLSLAEIARSTHGNGTTVNEALEEGWKRGVSHAMADGMITQAEEAKLREFRDRLALADSDAADPKAAAQLSRASTDRLMLDARLAALAVDDATDTETHLNELSSAITQEGLNPHEATALLTRAWEVADEGIIEDGLLTLVLQAAD